MRMSHCTGEGCSGGVARDNAYKGMARLRAIRLMLTIQPRGGLQWRRGEG